MSSASLTVVLSGVQQQLIRYVYSIWLIFGVPGCILDAIIFSRRRLRKISCCNYFFAASISNLATLIVGVGPGVYSLDYPDLLIHSLYFCKIRGYLFQIGLMVSRWFVVFACIDRYTQSSDNARLRNFASARMSIRSIIGIIIFWSIICTHRLIFYEIKGTICGIVTNFGAALYHALYVTIGGGILPAGIMIGCALLIRRNLARKRQRRQQQVTTVASIEHGRQKRSLDHQVLNLLLIQSACYIVLTTPQVVNLLYSTASSTIPNRTADTLAINGLLAFVAELMLYIFPVASFYLYTLTARTFRGELIKIFRSLPIPGMRCGATQIAPVDNDSLATHPRRKTHVSDE
ncbi:unnamed protein product [Adineta steineri]|uniref:G-protein coupled receptors family 1 profile domain-containing protein n=1 Tax=Adineta steineri TaxID=433720 RepID=A0A819NFG8_9BILA|nr:unnamed protein product [Adineta steineri]CAF3994027.1 unnamed protein product [Adineta steineri]